MRISNRIRRDFAPLMITRHYEVIGSALTQVYKAVELEYEPDRAITPTVVTPVVSVADPDKVYPDGVANRALGEMKWYVNGVDVTTTADFINGIYSIDMTDSATRGSLTVRKNVAAQSPVILTFKAVLPDTRTGFIVPVAFVDLILTTQDVASDKYTVELNKPVEYIFNPLTAVSNSEEFTAVCYRGANVIANNTAGLSFSILKRVGGTFVAATATNCPELLSSDEGAYTFEMRLIGKEDYMIKLLKDGSEVAAVQFSIVRQYPIFTVEMMNFGDILAKQMVIPARAIVMTRNEVVPSAGNHFTIVWHTVTTSKGDVEHNMGVNAEIPADKTGIDASTCEIYCNVEEKTEMQLASNSEGVVYVNSAGVAYIFN